LIAELATTCAARLEHCESVGEWFDWVSEEVALPIALWSREPDFQSQLVDVLDCLVKTLPNRIHQERQTAHKSKGNPLLGHHLSLVWEDPKIVPPDMQFDPEAC
jgi:vWA-MoxR associated protein C-terminal domain